jgi:hypothetical protein
VHVLQLKHFLTWSIFSSILKLTPVGLSLLSGRSVLLKTRSNITLGLPVLQIKPEPLGFDVLFDEHCKVKSDPLQQLSHCGSSTAMEI